MGKAPNPRYIRRRLANTQTRLATVLFVFALLFAPLLPADAAPGTPGVPQDATVIFEEDFQNRAPNSNILLNGYTGASGMTYSADSYWVDRSACNGFIVNYDSPYQAPDCDNNLLSPSGVYNNMLSQVYALGVHNGAADPEAFPAVAAYTEGAGPANSIQFQTDDKVPMPAGSNFVSFSVDVAGINCDTQPVQPQFRFYLVDENNIETPISADPINPCTDPGSQDLVVPNPNGGTSDVRVGTFVAPGAILFDGNELGIIMRNEVSGGTGNDSAFTNIRVLNVSPQLDKAFVPKAGGYVVGDDIPITFSITNTIDLVAKPDWSFADNLPTGLVVSDNPAISNTCSNTVVNAASGASSLTVNGDLNDGQGSCQITVNLTTNTPGTFTNGATNMSVAGLTPPGQSSVIVGLGPQLADTGIGSSVFTKLGIVLFVSSVVMWRLMTDSRAFRDSWGKYP